MESLGLYGLISEVEHLDGRCHGERLSGRAES